ncbi:hypothetical protein JCM14124_19670 [Humidesulfovibrio idahonensis]
MDRPMTPVPIQPMRVSLVTEMSGDMGGAPFRLTVATDGGLRAVPRNGARKRCRGDARGTGGTVGKRAGVSPTAKRMLAAQAKDCKRRASASGGCGAGAWFDAMLPAARGRGQNGAQ